MIDDQVYELYKPLRNELRKYSLEDVLSVVRAYSQALNFNQGFPSDLQPIPTWNDLSTGVHSWELDLIAREAIINCANLYTPNTLRKALNFARTVNKLKELENSISEKFVSTDTVLRELDRIAHRQFVWQTDRPTNTLLYRYYRIFNEPRLQKIIESVFGMNTHQVYLIGILMTGAYINQYALFYPPDLKLPSSFKITQKELDSFLDHFSKGIDELKSLLKSPEERQLNENFVYYFDSLKAFPLIKLKTLSHQRTSLVCPIPTLLFWRFTNGIYYELYNVAGFDQAFGNSFQTYTGDVLERALKHSQNVNYLPEEPEVRRGLPSSDWIVQDDKAAIFIECKTKRMAMAAKIDLSDSGVLEEQLNKLADAAIQIYKAVHAYQNNRLKKPVFTINNRRIFPLVLTLESWQLFGPSWDKFLEIVRKKLKDSGFPADWITKMPPSVCSMSEFERLIGVINEVGSVQTVLGGKVDSPEKSNWGIDSYLFKDFKTEIDILKEIFEADFESDFPEAKRKKPN